MKVSLTEYWMTQPLNIILSMSVLTLDITENLLFMAYGALLRTKLIIRYFNHYIYAQIYILTFVFSFFVK
jgi:hypothetical protein